MLENPVGTLSTYWRKPDHLFDPHEFAQLADDPDREALAAEEFELDGWVIERTCPHRQADLKVFGEIDGDEFVCTLHGWRFDLATDTCRNAADHHLRVRRAQ